MYLRLVWLMGWAAETVFGGIGVFFWLLSSFYSTGHYAHATIFLVIAVAFHHTLFSADSTDFR